MIANLALDPDGRVDWQFVEACDTTITLERLMLLDEIAEVGRSWRDAFTANGELAAARDQSP